MAMYDIYSVLQFDYWLPDFQIYIEPKKLCLFITVFILSATYIWKNNYQDFPPGPWGLPFIGSLKLLNTKPHLHLSNLKNKYGDVYSIKLGQFKAVVVCSMDTILEGLVKESPKFGERPRIFSTKLLYNGSEDGGICFTDLSLKYKMKKDFLLKSIDHICSNTRNLEDLLCDEAERIVYYLLAQKQPCDIAMPLESTILRVMLYLVNGKLYDTNDDNFIEIWRTFELRNRCCSDHWSVFVPLIQKFQQHDNMEIWERTRLQYEYQRSIINRHKDCFNPTLVSDMIDHMLVTLEKNEDMGVLDQDDLDHMFVEISGSGYRTISITLQWLLLYVSTFPDVQHKIHAELVSVVGKDRLPQLSDQPYLPYTGAVVMETQRLATVMPFLYPHSTREDETFAGYRIPKDTIMLFNMWNLHHDSRYWKHPMKFDPTRFLKEDGTLHIPDKFMPYGDGIRGCPGESLADIALFIFTTHLLYQVVVTLPVPAHLDGEYSGYMLTPKPYEIKATARNPAQMSDDMDEDLEMIPEHYALDTIIGFTD